MEKMVRDIPRKESEGEEKDEYIVKVSKVESESSREISEDNNNNEKV